MHDIKEQFEATLAELIDQARFDDWRETLLVYADFLEEQNDPLSFMARSKKELLWGRHYLTLDCPDLDIRRCRNFRDDVNYHSMLGFRPTTLRLVMPVRSRQRFTVMKEPRVSAARMEGVAPDARPSWLVKERQIYVRFDTMRHPWGFASLFVPDLASEQNQSWNLFSCLDPLG